MLYDSEREHVCGQSWRWDGFCEGPSASGGLVMNGLFRGSHRGKVGKVDVGG